MSPAAMYDGSDNSSMYQDIAGSIAVASADDPIAIWQDLSGNDDHLELDNTDLTERPLWKTTGVLFDGVNDYLKVTFGSSLSQPYTIIISAKLEGGLSLNNCILSSSGSQRIFGINSDDFIAQLSLSKVLSTPTDLDEHVWSLAYGTASAAITAHLDDTEVATDLVVGSQALGGLAVGALFSGAIPTNITVSRIAVFDRLLSDSDRQTVQTWADLAGVL